MTRALVTVCVALGLSANACTGEISTLPPPGADSGIAGGYGTGGGLVAAGGASNGGSTASGGVVQASGGTGARPGSGGSTGGTASTGGSAAGGGLGGPVCPGTAPPASGYHTCRVATECPPGSASCDYAPQPSCGACVPPPNSECTADSACGTGRICEPYSLQITCLCGAPPNPLRRCVPSCASTGCPSGVACGANGRCPAQKCTAGYVCPEAYACAPTRTGADEHGCAPADCNVDAYQCPKGFRCEPGKKCVPIACGQGFDCAPNLDCVPTSTAPHGCVRRACTTDADCDCGACINALCQDRMFVCSLGAP